ncbi:hypothetical protein FLK61_29650 [Paenalkalicoccus suaedae]|uniref:LysM domain-containing protein n=1 Tax=Paenalkalicoccus suaedae TaxID=2592382 RepID=A0A859FC15_9BACI|nr:hypothetical protein [Paenalkalicoccus suaedae]QKS70893.1 hypothetical protein FLK61_29650 [Paenalkalicoccus suaedae]
MRRLLLALLLLTVTILGVRHDLTIGTLQIPSVQKSHVDVIVESGQTYTTIIQQLHIPEEITEEQVLHDFLLLNDSKDPEELQAGSIYRFPIYDIHRPIEQ